jgi:predicted phage terminase large subunit-like protein
VLGIAGVDTNDNLWILPDLVWDRMETDRTVDEMIRLMKQYEPMMWWMESELISKSFGPFLYKTMQEQKVYTYVDPVSVHKTDKMLRARSIQGRMSHRKVKFPRFAPWWNDARGQLLKFPYAAKDDFVDFLAHMGQGLLKEIRASPVSEVEKNSSRPGSMAWVLKASRERMLREKRVANSKGW